MTTKTRFNPGDPVVILDSQHRYCGQTTVDAVRARTVTTANGQVWALDGGWWSGGRNWNFPFIVLPAEGRGQHVIGEKWTHV